MVRSCSPATATPASPSTAASCSHPRRHCGGDQTGSPPASPSVAVCRRGPESNRGGPLHDLDRCLPLGAPGPSYIAFQPVDAEGGDQAHRQQDQGRRRIGLVIAIGLAGDVVRRPEDVDDGDRRQERRLLEQADQVIAQGWQHGRQHDCFPGSPDGSFSEVLAAALLDWAADADCFVDLHGGDLCENVAHFTIAQTVGDPEFDRRNQEIAACFDPEILVRLAPSHLDAPGRSCTGRATQRRHAAFAEAGRIGLIEEHNVAFHLNGLLRLAHLHGMIDTAPPLSRRPVLVDDYLWLPAPSDGLYRYVANPGQRVLKGEILARIKNLYGDEIGTVKAPRDGHLLWSLTHALVMKDTFVMGLGITAG
nr:succinylglutamate desuccinylase/aspartoacylase family protein [Rhodoligotrophos appendicifer]